MASLLSSFENPFQRHPAQGQREQLKKLPRRVLQVFLLSRLDDLPFADIAQRLHLTQEQVEKDMTQVLEQGRDHLQTDVSMASHWYVRLQCAATTASERIDFRRWLDADPAHLHAFHATELHWRALLAPARELGKGQWYRQPRRSLGMGSWSLLLLTLSVLGLGCLWY
ncbi:DUF4880 domain-containing protein [Pseudomonas sp. R5(2019)]|uniref:DUF4880 domain-containing protein n=1 Tax=Pseudomonas sp. R5(2019) TaxID=2697566 RepID=UPI001411D7E1|nr:DUF4880 domain-containing protein [Pseudomonas sp. R5(2019)]NBA95972.1 DUF4880 domain-containing protein [Pseudomonas sp. R5(2019)]